MRKTPSDQHTIIELLEKCDRNLKGVLLRSEEVVAFQTVDLSYVENLIFRITKSLSDLDGKFVGRFEVVTQGRPKQPPKQISALEQYRRKYK